MIDLDFKCSGCGAHLTTENIGGYRCFCTKCVQSFPDFPRNDKSGRGYNIEGQTPNFKWIKSRDKDAK